MSVVSLYVEKLPSHPLLGRNVLLDSRSKAYAVQPKDDTPVVDVMHWPFIGILDQGQIGACTGNAGCSCAYHSPFFAQGQANWTYTPDEPGAQSWYHDNTANDSYAGTWKPDDTGSDGLTTSKMAVRAGIASGYQAALDLDSSLKQLMKVPGVTGIPWYSSMFDAPSSGLLTVDVKSGLAGGHELCVDQVITAKAPGNGTGEILVAGPNSWNESWGLKGRWAMKASDWWALRQQQGDVYFWVPNTEPAPTPPGPAPVVAAEDQSLWGATAAFRHDHHVMPHIVAASSGLTAWGAKKGLV